MTDQELIEKYIDPEWDRYGGRADARLRDYGVPVWALIGHLRAVDGDMEELGHDYGLPPDAVQGALAFYRQNKEYIDARLLLNSA